MKVSGFRKYSGIALVVGVIVLIMSIVCFAVLGIMLGNLEGEFGYKPTVSEAKEMLEMAEGMAQMLGGDISDLLGVSDFQVFFIKFSMSMRIPLLVVGILLIGVGVALRYVHADFKTMDCAKTGIDHSISSASTALKGFIDKATSKCPKCGKVCSAKTAFCPSCGERTVKPEIVARPPKASAMKTYTCPNCKKVYSEKIAFCSACGQKIPDETASETRCRNCGAVNPSGAKFCSSCGNDLGVRRFDDPIKPATVSVGTKEKLVVEKEEKPYVPIVHTSDRTSPAKPMIEVVPEKKNPFMSKPKDL